MDPLTYLGVAPFLTMDGFRRIVASERSAKYTKKVARIHGVVSDRRSWMEAQKHRPDIREVADRCKKRKCESGTDVGQCDQVKKWRAQNAKHALRRAKALQRRLEQGKVQKNHCHRYDRKILRVLDGPRKRRCRPLPEQTSAGANHRPSSLPGPMGPLIYLGVAPFLTMEGSRQIAASERSAKYTMKVATSCHAALTFAPQPRFSAGQSLLQWWAYWFKNEGPPPKVRPKYKRPAWWTREILTSAVWAQGKTYGGGKYTGWAYRTASWNGPVELVPEPYLVGLSEVPVDQRKHSHGLCIDPPPPPAFWMAGKGNKV